jgi:rhodanese-related sulfurtransferase
MKQLLAVDLSQWLRAAGRPAPVLLDVREPWEFAIGALPGSTAMPMREIPARLGELDPQRPIVCVCHHGHRSLQVAHFLEQRGFADVSNLFGGVAAWSRDVDPSFPTY